MNFLLFSATAVWHNLFWKFARIRGDASDIMYHESKLNELMLAHLIDESKVKVTK